jgi:maltose O-acetyltransferase
MAPVRADGEGRVIIGHGNYLGYWLAPKMGSGEILLQARTASAEIRIGHGNAFSNNVSVVANQRVEIADRCQIGDMAAIYDSDFHEIDPATRLRSAGESRPVRIGSNVWLGSRCMVLKGVAIGDNSVIGAMSLVTKSIPPNCLAAGIPARVIRSIGPESGGSRKVAAQ